MNSDDVANLKRALMSNDGMSALMGWAAKVLDSGQSGTEITRNEWDDFASALSDGKSAD